MKKRITYLLLSIICFISLFLFLKDSAVHAEQTIYLVPIKDSFVRENYPVYNYGSWNDLTIGRSYNMGNYFARSWAYIDFDLSNLDASSIIKKAELEMYQYARSDYAEGNYNVTVARARDDWSEMNITWNNKPSIAGIYEKKSVSGYSSQWFNPPQKNTFDVTNLVREWVNDGVSEYGMALYKDVGNFGGFWCSRNYNNSTCFKHTRPRLKITYTTNHSPNIPNPYSPSNLSKLGGDSSSEGSLVTLKVKGLGDSEDNLKETYFYYKLKGASSWIRTEKRTGKKTAQYTQNFSDGDWVWKARSVDTMGAWSEYSPIMEFRVDTIPPENKGLVSIEPFQKGSDNTIEAKKSQDNFNGDLYYKFQLSSGANCDMNSQVSGWQESRFYTFTNLEDEINYCYKVKVKDFIGNTSSYSDHLSALQDGVKPQIDKFNLSNNFLSPNKDLKYDHLEVGIEVFDKNFEKWELQIFDTKENKIKSFENETYAEIIIWNGKNSYNDIVKDGNYLLKIEAKDQAGNITQKEKEVIVDTLHPNLDISFPTSNSYFNSAKVELSGITEVGAVVQVNRRDVLVDDNGIFISEVNLEPGENIIEITSEDVASNLARKEIKINREMIKPEMQLLSPLGLLNNKKPTIRFEFADEESGVNPDSVNLSLVDSNNTELELISSGINLQEQFGEIHTDCSFSFGEASKLCNYSYILKQDLAKDGKYRIKANIKDYADNLSLNFEENFYLDSETYINVEKPKGNILLNYSNIDLEFLVEKEAQVEITHPNFNYNFVAEEKGDNVVTCFKSNNDEINPNSVVEICKVKLADLKLETNDNNDIEVENEIKLNVEDRAGNKKVLIHKVVVNLYAIELAISSNLDFISPNGDGRQDGTEFRMYAKNSENDSNTFIKSWRFVINRNFENVFLYNFHGPISDSYYFNGKNQSGDWLENGDYTYFLEVETSDGILLQTPKKDLYVRKDLEEDVVITHPKSDSVTTRGVINIQGQAPIDSKVKICVDYVNSTGVCNDEQIVEVDANGFYSVIVPLSAKENLIWAQAFDKFGNESDRSNEVKVVLDVIDPFISVEALPEIVAANKQVLLRSIVTNNTEKVEYNYANFSELNELPSENKDYLIGAYYEENCDKNECVWDYIWKTPNVKGGVFEIIFQAKKAEKISTMSLGVRIDGTVPTKPNITSLVNNKTKKKLNYNNKTYLTNSLDLKVSGIGEALSFVIVNLKDRKNCTSRVNAIGKWSCNIVIDEVSESQLLTVSSYDKVGNESEKSSSVSIIYDDILPSLEDIVLNKKYLKSGDNLAVEIFSSEKISTASIARKDNVSFNLLNLSNLKHFGTLFPIESNAKEGEYFLSLEFTDLAGNINHEEVSINIDNTSPNIPEMHTSQWGKYNGFYAKNKYPSKGRLVPQFVTRNRQLFIEGNGEQNTYVQIYVNSKKRNEEFISAEHCSQEDLYYTQAISECKWNQEIKLNDNKANVIQLRSCDRAGNCSGFSDEHIVYLDNKKPLDIKLLQTNDYWRSGNLFYTNRQKITFFGIGERKSDFMIEIYRKNKRETKQIHKFSNKGELNNYIKLARDGEYELRFISSDAAGNYSNKKNLKLVKDTRAPKRPKVSKTFICGNKICSRISGEIGSKVFVNGTLKGTLNSEFQKIILQNKWEYNQNLIFELFQEDRAKNRSEANRIRFKTPTASGGGSVLGDKTDIWKDSTGQDLDPISAVIKIYPDRKLETDFKITPPEILGTNTNLDASMSFWGTHTLDGKVKVEFYKKHEEDKVRDLKKAFENCRWYKYVPGISIFYTPKCVRDNYKQIQNSYELERVKKDVRFQPENFQVLLYENNKRISTSVDSDLESGRWEKTFGRGVLLSGREVSAKLKIWGRLDVEGHVFVYDKLSASSNAVVIKELPKFTRSSVNPMSDSSCNGYLITSLYGNRVHPISGKITFHTGIDVAKYGGCDIVASFEGNASTMWYAGKTVKIEHSDVLETRYGHANYYNGIYPRNVDTKEKIMRMGCSGMCTGTHIHFEIWENGEHKDPRNYFKF